MGSSHETTFLEGEQVEKTTIKLTKVGMKISGKKYYGVTNPSLKFLDPIINNM